MIDAAILKAMVAAGATLEVILATVEAAQTSEEKKLAERRAADAQRKRESRARLAASHDVTDVTNGHTMSQMSHGHGVTGRDSKANSLKFQEEISAVPEGDDINGFSSSYLLTKEESKKETKQERKGVRGKTICPEDFQPTEKNLIYGTTLGYDARFVASLATEMIEWSASNGEKKLDWPLTLNVWMRRRHQERVQQISKSQKFII